MLELCATNAICAKPSGDLHGRLPMNQNKTTRKGTQSVASEIRTGPFRLRTRFERLRGLVASFHKNKRANVAVMAGMSALPLIIAVGCAIDYTMATSAKAKLQAGADAATLAAVSVNSPVVASAQAMGSSNGSVTNGTTYLSDLFQTNYPTSPTPTISSSSVNKSGMTVTATLSFTAQIPTSFLGIIGINNITVTGSSTSSYTMATYISFYLLLDVSGSMSFPSTQAEQARLQAVNPDNMNPNTPGSNGYPGGCTFACHFTRQGACTQSGSGNGPYQGPTPGTVRDSLSADWERHRRVLRPAPTTRRTATT
jgi:Flp pilus assembly protein TadG